MCTILLINPNTSSRTTDMMLAVARPLLRPGSAIRGATAAAGPPMILDEVALAGAAEEVVRLGLAGETRADAVVVAAFGDPGVEELRARLSVPVVGIAEAAMREAASGGRRFGIATTTLGLARVIETRVRRLGLGQHLTGLRVTEADPVTLAADPSRQDAALAQTTSDCIERDGADVVIIGGGPLSDTAARLRSEFGNVIIEPIPAAMRALRESF